MVALHEGSTYALSPTFLRKLRAMLDVAYDGDFSDQDWQHAVGGNHVWVTGRHRLVAHASLIARTLVCSGKTLHVGFVEAVATAAAHRGRGHGARVMGRIAELIREGYPLGVLSTGTHAFYERLGWERWRGPTFVDGPNGRERTPADDGDVMILRTPRSPHLDVDGDIVCDWRLGDVW
jgi:aminoglycoside 2'-N-acetyltransferase I